MCRDLRALRQSIKEYAADFDVHTLLPSQAAEVVKICSQIEASVSTIKNLAFAKSAEGTAWKHAGYRSPADQVAQQTGMSPGRAKKALQTGQRMLEHPEVAAAALAGELSPEQAAAVADGAAANPDKAKELVDKAKEMSMPDLNQEVAKVKAEVTDLEERRKQLHATRYLTHWTDDDGAGHAHMFGNPECNIALWQALDPIRRRLVLLRRDSKEGREDFKAIDHDALMILAAAATGKEGELTLSDLLDLGLFPQLDSSVVASRNLTSPGAGDPDLLDLLDPDPPPLESDKPKPKKKFAGSPMKLIIRVDLDALLRGYPLEGELCEIAGIGKIPPSLIEDLMATGNVTLAIAFTHAWKVDSVHLHRRRPNEHQKVALDLLYPECAVNGCKVRQGLQADHREDWIKTHYTVLDLLDYLCPHHHRLKTNKGWALVEGRGKRDFVPPDDARHPRHTKKTGADPPALSACTHHTTEIRIALPQQATKALMDTVPP